MWSVGDVIKFKEDVVYSSNGEDFVVPMDVQHRVIDTDLAGDLNCIIYKGKVCGWSESFLDQNAELVVSA